MYRRYINLSTLPLVGVAEHCVKRVCLCVCLSVCPHTYLQNYMSDLRQFFCAIYQRPWLGLSLAALRRHELPAIWMTSYTRVYIMGQKEARRYRRRE